MSGSAPRRRRALLADFYGQKSDGDGGDGGDGKSGKNAAVHNIDSAQFDAALHCEKLLSSESLATLQKKSSALDGEISALDGEMKTLVYENYNKFIAATDTIKTMRGNMKNLEGEMQVLQQSMDALTARAAAIDASLAEPLRSINELGSVHSLLQKLQFIVELPQRIERCIEMDAYAQAVQHYEQAKPLLRQHADELASFRSIDTQCTTLIERLRKQLRDELANGGSPGSSAVALLVKLGDDREQLAGQYMEQSRRAVNQLLAELDADHGALERVAKRLLVQLVDTYDGYVDIFGQAEALEAQQWCQKTTARFLTAARAVLVASGRADAILAQLRPLHAEMTRAHQERPVLAFAERANDFARQTVNEIIGSVLDDALQHCTSVLHGDDSAGETVAAADDNGDSGDNGDDKSVRVRLSGDRMGEAVASAIERGLNALPALFEASMDESDALLARQSGMLATKVQVKLQQVMLTLNLVLMDYIDPPRTGELPPRFDEPLHVLRLVHTARFVQLRAVSRCRDALLGLLTLVNSQNDATINVPALQGQFAHTSRALLDRYASLAAQSLTGALVAQRGALDACASTAAPLLAAIVDDVACCGFLAHDNDAEHDDSAAAAAIGTSAAAASLFQKRVDVFATPPLFSKQSVCNAILARWLKSVVQLTRHSSSALPQKDKLLALIDATVDAKSPALTQTIADLEKASKST